LESLGGLGSGLGAACLHELPEGVVCFEKLLAASLPVALGVDEVTDIGTPRLAACVSRAAVDRHPDAASVSGIFSSVPARISSAASVLIASSKKSDCAGAIFGALEGSSIPPGSDVLSNPAAPPAVGFFMCSMDQPRSSILRSLRSAASVIMRI
jgi:hypothetical protein